MQETITFPTMGSPHHRFTFSQSYDTDFSERCSQVSTPFVSAPSSPGRHCDGGFYFSAPASPHWAYTFSQGMQVRTYPSSIPLHWDEQPGTPRRRSNGKDEAGSFLMTSDFEFSARFAELDDPSRSPMPMSSANELFCNGKIKPLKTPTRIDLYPSCSSSRTNMEEHIAASRISHGCALTALPSYNAFEFDSRGVYPEAPNSSMSTPHSPCFSSVLGGIDDSSCRSVSSLSAPQSPRSPINRGKEALCKVSPSRIERAFDTSIHTPMVGEGLRSSNRLSKPFGTSAHMSLEGSTHTFEGSRHVRECSRRSEQSMLSRALGSQATGHRRTRSFSPLRIFHRGEHPTSSSPVGTTQQEDSTHTFSRDSSANEKKGDNEPNSVSKSLNKRWTLKDLLHRKSGGENRWNGSRASSRRSGASTDSTSSVERIGVKTPSTGRSSSSESSRFSLASCNTHTKDVSTAKLGSKGRMQGGESMSNQSNSNDTLGKKGGLKQAMYEAKANNTNKRSLCKAKSSSQKGMTGVCVQKGNNEKGCVSPHEMHYMMHKAQSEELRKRTFLPYRQGLLGCLGFTSKSYRTVSSISKTLQSVSG